MKVLGQDHLHIYTTDPKGSAAFYHQHFDANIIPRGEDEAGPSNTTVIELGGRIVLLSQFPEGTQAAEPSAYTDGAYALTSGISHFGLRVEDLKQALDELRAAGVKILTELQDHHPGVFFAYVEAPDGVIVELAQYDITLPNEA